MKLKEKVAPNPYFCHMDLLILRQIKNHGTGQVNHEYVIIFTACQHLDEAFSRLFGEIKLYFELAMKVFFESASLFLLEM
jgi:hypothetical protein